MAICPGDDAVNVRGRALTTHTDLYKSISSPPWDLLLYSLTFHRRRTLVCVYLHLVSVLILLPPSSPRSHRCCTHSPSSCIYARASLSISTGNPSLLPVPHPLPCLPRSDTRSPSLMTLFVVTTSTGVNSICPVQHEYKVLVELCVASASVTESVVPVGNGE